MRESYRERHGKERCETFDDSRCRHVREALCVQYGLCRFLRFFSSSFAFLCPISTGRMLSSALLILTGRLPTYLPFSYQSARCLPSKSVREGLTVHFFPCFEEVLRVRECNKTILCLKIHVSGRDEGRDRTSNLLAEAVTDDTSLLERSVLVESTRQDVI